MEMSFVVIVRVASLSCNDFIEPRYTKYKGTLKFS